MNENIKKCQKLFILALVLAPASASAQLTGVGSLIDAVGGLINPLIAVLVAIALLGFFWGLAKFIFRVGGDEKAVEDGKRIMKWGLIALFVMVSVWGIIKFMQDALLPGGGGAPAGSNTGGGAGNTSPGGEFPFTPYLPPGQF